MTMPTSALVAFLAATTSSSKSTTTSGASFFIPLVIFGLLAWLLFLRPRSQQAKRQRQDMTNVDIGDEVLTGAGIFGTIVAMEGDRIVLETAPGSQVTVLRSTIARRLTETEPVADDHDDWDDDEDSHEVRSSGGGATTDVHDIDVGGTDTIDQNGKSEPGLGDTERGEGSARSGEGG